MFTLFLSKVKISDTSRQNYSALAIRQFTYETVKYRNSNSKRLSQRRQLNTITANDPMRSSTMTIHNVVICNNT